MTPLGATGASPKRIGNMLPNETYARVLNALVEQKSMAFLELTSFCNLGRDELREIISRFEEEGIISVSNHGDIVDQVVTLRGAGFALARRAAKEKELTAAPSLV